MKKLLVIAFMSLFAVSAFAVEMNFYGSAEFYGYMVSNRDASADAKTAAFYDQHVYLYGKAMIDPDAKAALNFRFKIDSIFGTNPPNQATYPTWVDRVWVDYQFVDCVKLSIGRNSSLRTKNAWGRSFFYTGTAGNQTRDQIKAVFTVNDNVAIRAQLEKHIESEVVTTVDGDYDIYLAAADMKFDNLGIYPVVTFLKNQDSAAQGYVLGAHVGVDYVPASGFNFQGVVAATMLADQDNSDADYTVFGAMADFSYVADKYKAGFIFAYAGTDDDAGGAFSFGADWDKTKIVDQSVSWNWNDTPATGAMAFYLYGDYMMTDSLTLGAIGALYMATGDIYTFGMLGSQGKWVDDPMVIEVDLKAKYNFTKNTFASGGAAVAFVTEDLASVGGAPTESMDPVMVFWWGLQTNF